MTAAALGKEDPRTSELLAFWPRQMEEHALFLSLGLEDPALRAEAARERDRWRKFRARRREGPAEAAEALALAADLRALKVRVHDRLAAGEWLGWLFPSFVDHIRRELDYFTAALRRARRPEPGGSARRASEEMCSWLMFMMEHAAFAAHLLDPREVRLVLRARALIGDFGRLHAACGGADAQLLSLSERAGRALDAYFVGSGLGTARARSVVHPALAAHVVREGRMFLRTVLGLMGRRPGPAEELPGGGGEE